MPGQPLSQLTSSGLQPHVSTFLTLFRQERLGEEVTELCWPPVMELGVGAGSATPGSQCPPLTEGQHGGEAQMPRPDHRELAALECGCNSGQTPSEAGRWAQARQKAASLCTVYTDTPAHTHTHGPHSCTCMCVCAHTHTCRHTQGLASPSPRFVYTHRHICRQTQGLASPSPGAHGHTYICTHTHTNTWPVLP